jgi:hypothetical protein
MRSTACSSASVGVLVLLCLAPVANAQSVTPPRPITHIASVSHGAILGNVLDERGKPVAGAMVSALGATSAFAVSDRTGRFELLTLPPGPYVVRAHLVGFVASRGQVVEVRPSGRASSSISLRHANPPNGAAAAPVLAAWAAARTASLKTPPAIPQPYLQPTITASWRGGCGTSAAGSSKMQACN